MARFTPDNVQRAREVMASYPVARSALIPLLHLAQEQDGWVTDDAMRHIAELLDLTPAEVLGTCSFYEMFKRQPVGRYLVNVCTNVSCMLLGAYELLAYAEASLGVRTGSTTADGLFTLGEAECLANCDHAPCFQVNYRYFENATPDSFDAVVADLRADRLADTVPPHGTTNRVRRAVPVGAAARRVQPDAEPESTPPGGPVPVGPESKDDTAPTRKPAGSPRAKKASKPKQDPA